MCVNYVLALSRITQVDPDDGPICHTQPPDRAFSSSDLWMTMLILYCYRVGKVVSEYSTLIPHATRWLTTNGHLRIIL
jgi:hypothetical protein